MKVIVFDMDGTLADCSWRLHHIQKEPKDYDTFYELMNEDSCFPIVLKVAHALEKDNYIVICTGRPTKYLEKIREWLQSKGLNPIDIFTRADGDHREDHIIKKELLQEMREFGFEPEMVFEDRDSVVKMWRDEGITCFQVKDGSY